MVYLLAAVGVVLVILLIIIFKGSKDKPSGSADTQEYKVENLKTGISTRVRNLVILAVLLVLSVVWAVLSINKITKEHEELLAKVKKLEKEYSATEEETFRQEDVMTKLAEIKEEVFLNNKIIMQEDNSSKTLKYFLYLAERYAKSMLFDFGLTKSDFVENDAEVLYNTYVITGKSYINQVFSFIDQLERQAPFYSIESIALSSLSADEKGKVQFSLEIKAYHTATGTALSNIALRNNLKTRLDYNPFYPRIHSPVGNDSDEFKNLFDAESGSLMALTADRVFVRNNTTGMIEILKKGDKIKYGRLDRINWNKQQAVFRLNRYGIAEYIRLDLPKNLKEK